MPNVRELLEREGATVDLEHGHFERMLRRRDRKRQNQRIGTGALAIILALVSFLALTRAFSTDRRPADERNQPSPVVSSPVEVTFPMFPQGARPSTPVTGELELEFTSWPHSFPVVVDVYTDGRVIWHPDQDGIGYLQFRLTPDGVDEIRSMVISTGLVDKEGGLRVPSGPESRLLVRRGDRTVFVQWSRSRKFDGVARPKASSAQTRDIAELERFFGDPSAWGLPSDLYADPEIRNFVPYGVHFTYDRGAPDLSQIPSPARELLTRYLRIEPACLIIPTDKAREVVEALAQAGFAPLRNSPVYVDFGLPGTPSGPSNPHLTPELPHGLGCLLNGDR